MNTLTLSIPLGWLRVSVATIAVSQPTAILLGTAFASIGLYRWGKTHNWF